MFIVFEISRPVQWKPHTFKSGLTIFSVCWLLFRISIHPIRYDEMIELAMNGNAIWGGR
jgi:hypothetical protein